MKDQIPEGFVPNNFKYVSNQPHVTRTRALVRESLKQVIDETPIDLLSQHMQQQKLAPVIEALKNGDRIQFMRVKGT